MNFLNSLFNFIQSATYQYFSFNIYVTDKSCIHTFTAKYACEYFCMTNRVYRYIAFTIYVTDKSCIHTFTAQNTQNTC